VTRVRISPGAFLEVLVEDLRQRADIVISVAGPNTIEVSLVGSYNAEPMKVAVELRLRAWEAARRAQGHDVRVEII
jgi:hypothetical protein